MKKTIFVFFLISAIIYPFSLVGSYFGASTSDFMKPVSAKYDYSGNLYILDNILGKLIGYDKKNIEKLVISGLKSPSGMVVIENKIYIVEPLYNRIKIFDVNSGKLFFEFGKYGMQQTEFNHPSKIYFWNNEIYIIDEFNERVQVFNKNNIFVRQYKLPHSPKLYKSYYTFNYQMVFVGKEAFLLDVAGKSIFSYKNEKIDSKKTAKIDYIKKPSGIFYYSGNIYVFDSYDMKYHIFSRELEKSNEYDIITKKMAKTEIKAEAIHDAASGPENKITTSTGIDEKKSIESDSGHSKNTKKEDNIVTKAAASNETHAAVSKVTETGITEGKSTEKAHAPAVNAEMEEISFKLKYELVDFLENQLYGDEYIYIKENNIFKMNLKTLKNEKVILPKGKTEGVYITPSEVSVNSSHIKVLDKEKEKLFFYDLNGKYLKSIDNIGKKPTGFHEDKDGNIYIAAAGENKIRKYDGLGNLLIEFGNYSEFPMNYTYYAEIKKKDNAKVNMFYEKILENKTYNMKVRVDNSGYIYILDSSSKKIKVYDQFFKKQYEAGEKADITSVIQLKKEAGRFGWDEKNNDTLTDMWVDNGNIYVCDNYFKRVLVFKKNKLIGTIDDKFKSVTSVFVKNGIIYIVDGRDFSIKKYDSKYKSIGRYSLIGKGTYPINFKDGCLIVEQNSTQYEKTYKVLKYEEIYK